MGATRWCIFQVIAHYLLEHVYSTFENSKLPYVDFGENDHRGDVPHLFLALSARTERSGVRGFFVRLAYIGPNIIAWSPSLHQFFGCRITWPLSITDRYKSMRSFLSKIFYLWNDSVIFDHFLNHFWSNFGHFSWLNFFSGKIDTFSGFWGYRKCVNLSGTTVYMYELWVVIRGHFSHFWPNRKKS